MALFEITICYSKIIDAVDKQDAENTIDSIADMSNLDSEYGPFGGSDMYTNVKEVTE